MAIGRRKIPAPFLDALSVVEYGRLEVGVVGILCEAGQQGLLIGIAIVLACASYATQRSTHLCLHE